MVPDPNLCTDNAIMIAYNVPNIKYSWAGYERYLASKFISTDDVMAKWPINMI